MMLPLILQTEDLTITGRNVTVYSASALLGDVSIIAANDLIALTAPSAEGDVTIIVGNDATLTDISASTGTVSVNASGYITVTNATNANTINLNNVGGMVGEDIIITDAKSAISATLTSR